ncbi:MAG: Mrp/NBP35 family ATP-binding protein [SAR202 cluster bacterium]|nr:Mrp/NBP35 family ATP-binding protein [SAR202 cluster bacterium]|tara:strand:+ start:35249 stop:36085 length:837 start_codon:yes stop_codon:yes gene_type:complete
MNESKPERQVPNPAQARAKIEQMKRQFEEKRKISDNLTGIKKIIGVYSGKGGVGKTTVAVNLAVTFAQAGLKVGLMDVDIDCPNVLKVLNVSGLPEQDDDQKMIPPNRWNVSVMSMGFFQKNEEEAIIWRGPMIHNAINQLLQATKWGDLDYLFIDLPPGTSDSPLTVMQTLTVDGFLIVTTPQDLAKIDAKRSINMIRTMKVDLLGIVENFSGSIFGQGGGKSLADEMKVPFLGSLALREEYMDLSKPVVLSNDDILKEYEILVENLQSSIEIVEKN